MISEPVAILAKVADTTPPKYVYIPRAHVVARTESPGRVTFEIEARPAPDGTLYINVETPPTNQKGPEPMNDEWPFLTRALPKKVAHIDAIAKARSILAAAGVKADIVLKAPQWKPGDVVVVRHDGPSSFPYTYVRSQSNWPGERFPKTDAQMTALYAEGKAKPVLEHGGVPFAPSRLP